MARDSSHHIAADQKQSVEWKKGRRRISGPSENPGQGDDPNIAPTRPQAFGPLTLVGQSKVVKLRGATPSKYKCGASESVFIVITLGD
jgi:hypothetical protein